MWLFTTYGFYSINTDPTNEDNLQFRARKRQDLENLIKAFPDCINIPGRPPTKILQFAGTDYPFRLPVHRDDAAAIVAELAHAVDYANFKHTMDGIPDQRDKVPFLMRVWSAMMDWQRSSRNITPDHEQTLTTKKAKAHKARKA